MQLLLSYELKAEAEFLDYQWVDNSPACVCSCADCEGLDSRAAFSLSLFRSCPRTLYDPV